MQRVLILGPCGAGKSTLGRTLAQRTGLPLHHMDRLHWKPGWVESTREELLERLTPILAGDRWIIEGNYGGTLRPRLQRADTVLVLDYPPRIYRYRVLKRIVSGYGRTRDDMTEGCPERLDAEFLRYVWRFDRDTRPRMLATLAERPAGQALHTFRHPRELDAFLATLGVGAAVHSPP